MRASISWLAWLALALALAYPTAAMASPGFTQTCEHALPKERVDELVGRMRDVAARGPCSIERLDTSMFQTVVALRHGKDVHTALLGPRECVVEASHAGADLAYYASPELERACPGAVSSLRDFVGDPRVDLAPVVRGRAPEIDAPEPALAPVTAATIAWLVAAGCALSLVVGRWRRRKPAQTAGDERAWVLSAAAVFAVALVARFSVEANVSNWYGPFLPAQGAADVRFGAASAVLQGGLRAVGPWTPAVAFGLIRVTGAIAAPLLLLLVRRLGGSLAFALVAALVIALDPIPVRLSASSDEHVLAGTLALAAWVVWLRTAHDAGWLPRVASLTLVALAVLTRVDVWPQLALIPLWTVLFGSTEAARLGWRPARARLRDAALFALVWAAIGAYAWFRIVIPSNHPGPEREAIVYTARVLFSQLWVVASAPPHWVSPATFALMVAGFASLVLARRWDWVSLFVISHALVFVPLGRNLTHDGLTGARYFVLALPLFALLAGHVGERANAWLGRAHVRWRPAALGIGVAAIALLVTLAARPGWRHTYTFQEEYGFLAEQLAERELAGCTLWFVRPRQPVAEPDLDCCLAPDRSPLALVAPALRFRAMPNESEPADADGCHLYYEGSVCAIDPRLAEGRTETVTRIHAQCERLRRRASGQLGARDVTGHSLNERWRASPRVTLFGD